MLIPAQLICVACPRRITGDSRMHEGHHHHGEKTVWPLLEIGQYLEALGRQINACFNQAINVLEEKQQQLPEELTWYGTLAKGDQGKRCDHPDGCPNAAGGYFRVPRIGWTLMCFQHEYSFNNPD